MQAQAAISALKNMKKFVVPLVCQLFALLVRGDEHPQPVGNWTVSNVSRTRSAGNETCDWKFQFSQSEAPPDTPPTFCQFTVDADNGHNCDTVTFSGAACNGTERYSVNGGHAPEGFIVMVLLDIEENVEAYFGFDDTALNTGAHIPEQTMNAYPPKSPSKPRARNVLEKPLLPRDNETTWTVKNMYRAVTPSEHRILIDMLILDGSPEGVVCQLALQAPEDADPETWGFSNANCIDNGWTVHWGYMSDQDAGVMTLVP
ncbi:hypothetical protein Daesc_006278 [Daldinia eschscholtzii]|uniref:Uncharacterized protein n=1 Tax=Daldinia eschscholtzii TaxID=292717 RepID=A0AAX6MGL9_9PEZI